MGGEDRTACAAGTFNKLIEKLVSIHPDAEQAYMNDKWLILNQKSLCLKKPVLISTLKPISSYMRCTENRR